MNGWIKWKIQDKNHRNIINEEEKDMNEGMWRMVLIAPREIMNKTQWVAIGGMHKMFEFGIRKIITLMA